MTNIWPEQVIVARNNATAVAKPADRLSELASVARPCPLRFIQALLMFPMAALMVALGGCASVPLKPRSVECSLAILVAPGAGCEPLARDSDGRDEAAKRFAPAAGMSNIYVVRPSIVGGRYVWGVRSDDRHVGEIAEHTYMLLEVEPGVREISVVTGENRHTVTVNAMAGKNHFLEAISRLGWTRSKAELRPLEQEQGRAAVNATRRVPAYARAASGPAAQ